MIPSFNFNLASSFIFPNAPSVSGFASICPSFIASSKIFFPLSVLINTVVHFSGTPTPPSDASASLSDMELTHRIFGFLPKVNLIEGLESLYWSMKNCDCEDFSYLGEKGGLL